MAVKCKFAGKSDIGLVRPGNEDYLHLDEEHFVFAVCDGMGGHQAGEIASMTASELIRMAIDCCKDQLLKDPDLDLGQDLPRTGDLLVKSIRLANRSIYNRSASDPDLAGMGSTIVAMALESDHLSVVHVGDSRAYRIETNQLTPLTVDHSWVAEIQKTQQISAKDAASFVGKNVITRALGVRENVEVDYRMVKVKPGDKFMLCSDGLCGFATDEEIFEAISHCLNDLDKMCDELIKLANSRGGSDNVTIITLEVLDVDSSDRTAIEAFTQPSESPELLAIEDKWIARIAERQKKKPRIPASQ